MTSSSEKAEKTSKSDRWHWPSWTPLAGGLALVVLGAMVIFAFVLRAGESHPITQLESALFTVLLFVLSTVGSLLVASYYGRQQARDRYVELAKPAWRRVKNLSRSAAQISEAIAAKREAAETSSRAPSRELTVEWLDSFSRLVAQHSGQLDDAVSDWQELLPEEFAQLSREREEIEATRAELAGKLAELGARQAEGEAAQAEEAAQAADDVVRLRGELARLKTKLEELEKKQYNPLTFDSSIFRVGSSRSVLSDLAGSITASGLGDIVLKTSPPDKS